MNPLSITVITDTHYYSKKNWLDGDPYKFPPARAQEYRQGSEEIIRHVFDAVSAKDEPEIILISGDITNNGEITSHMEMRELLRKLKANGKRVYLITATHDYSDSGFSYGFDKDNNEVPVPALKREELYDFYFEFGLNEALDIHKPSMSYVLQLADGCRLLALNDDRGNNYCGFTSDCLEWISRQLDKAKRDGEYVIAMTHHPLLAPSVFYRLIAPSDMLEDGENVAAFLADKGVRCIFTGHSHIQNISSLKTKNGSEIYDISTSCLVGYPPCYRKVIFNPQENSIAVTTTLVKYVPELKETGENLPVFLKELFLGVAGDILRFAETDYDSFTYLAIGFSLSRDKAYKLKPIIRPAAKYLNHLTFGRVWRISKKQSNVSKTEVIPIKDEPVVPYIISCASNLYKGDAQMDKTDSIIKFKVAQGFLIKADKMLKPFSKKLKSIGIDSLYTAAMPLLKRQKAISDTNAVIPFE